MASYYYLNERGEQVGPLSLEKIKALRLAPATLVWREGMAEWTRADKLTELRTTAAASSGMSVLRIVLIVFAVVGTLVFSLAGRFVSAFAASLMDAQAQTPAVILLSLFGAALILHAVFKRKKMLLEAALFSVPFMAASLVTIVYYGCNPTSYYRNGRCYVSHEGKHGVLNRWGLETVPCRYEYLAYNDLYNPEFFYAKEDGKYGIIDLQGDVIIPFEYDYMEPREGTDLLEVRQDGKDGLLRTDNSVVLPCAYDYVGSWHDSGLIKFSQGDLNGLITEDGEVVLPCRYLFAKQDETGLTKINEGGWVDSDNKIRGGFWGVIDEEGNILLGCSFEKVSINSEEIRTEGNGYISYYDLQGNYLYGLRDWH